MVYFPEILALNFSLVTDPESGSLIQSPIPLLEFKFQHMSNFDYYQPCSLDFYFLNSPTNCYTVLHSNLASCYWECLKMKCHYILAAATGWNDNLTNPLPTSIPEGKLEEISMISPTFPPIHQLTYNFLLLPEFPSKIHKWIELWQSNSRLLSAWITQAKVQSARLPSCSWNWPATPHLTYPTSSLPSSPLTSLVTTTKAEEREASITDSSFSTKHEVLSSECPELPSEYNTSLQYSFAQASNRHLSGRVAHAFHSETERNTLKRGREASPEDPIHDGSDAYKKQLVLWQPSLGRLREL